MTAPASTVTLRSVAASAFLPAFVYEIGNGAIAPVNALTAIHIGASPELAAFMLALPGIGQVLGDVPASTLAVRFGDRRAMTIAAGGAIVAMITCFFARSLWMLGPALLLSGMCNSTYYLGRQAYLIDVIPPRLRARAMSTLGGSHRVGLFCGPFVGAAVISLTDSRAVYVLAAGCAAAAALVLLMVADAERDASGKTTDTADRSLLALAREHRRLLFTLGTAVFAFSGLRAVRQVTIPLWAVHMGLGAEQTSIIFGIASAVDMVLFYPAGKVMDHFGRLAIGIPSALILGLSMLALPFTHTAMTLLLVAVVMSAANGIGAGIQLTIGADLAPAAGRIRFLSLWRVWSDTGQASGPVVLSIIAAVLSLGTGVLALGTLGIYTTFALIRWLPRYSPLATPAMMLAHRAELVELPDPGPEVGRLEPGSTSPSETA